MLCVVLSKVGDFTIMFVLFSLYIDTYIMNCVCKIVFRTNNILIQMFS